MNLTKSHTFLRIKKFLPPRLLESVYRSGGDSIRVRWGKLADDQLELIAGKRVELAGKIQEAYGVSKDEVNEPALSL